MRGERTETTTTVRYVAVPLGSKGRENGPHLGDLRRFVEECEGLPDSIVVHIDKGHMDSAGRYDVTLRASWKQPAGGAS